MIAIEYKWTIEQAHLQAFLDAWTRMTEIIRQRHGGLGSRLHQLDSGEYMAYAQWPSDTALQAWREAALKDDEAALIESMRKASTSIGQSKMVVLVDLLALPRVDQ